jgi:magnesium transporter
LIQLEQRIRGGALEVENSIFGSDLGDGSNDVPPTASQTDAKNVSKMRKAEANSLTKPLRRMDLPVSSKQNKEALSETESEANSEWEEMQANEWTDLPFELQAADSVLYVVCSFLSQDAYDLQEDTLGYINDILSSQSGLQDDPLLGIRHVKDSVREMNSRIKGFVQSMNRVLDDDEDLALMNLTRLRTHPQRFVKPVSKEILDEEADEPELILEAHLQIGLTLQNALDLIQGQIDTASELIDQKLDASRNRLLFTNMVLNMLTLCVTMGTYIAGIFGMNLISYKEASPIAWFQVVYGTVGGMVVLLILMIWGLVGLGVVPRSIFRA